MSAEEVREAKAASGAGAKQSGFVIAATLSVAACSLAPLPLADDPVKCSIALAMEEPIAAQNTGHSIQNLHSFADYFDRKAREISGEERAARARNARRVFSDDPELHKKTAKACVEEAMRQLG